MYKDNKKYFDESYSEGCIGYIKSARKPMVFRPWDEWRQTTFTCIITVDLAVMRLQLLNFGVLQPLGIVLK